MSDTSYGFGIVGAGMISNFHAKAIAAMNGGHLVAVTDRVPERAQAFAEANGCTAHNTLDAMLADPGVDVVTICTPSGAHLDPALAAANAGKHIICEKPLEITLEKIDAMIAACNENNVGLAGVFPRRFNGAVENFKKAIDTGRFGTIALAEASIKWFRTQEYYDSGAWRGTWALDGGGALMNQSVHTIDLLLHLMGDVTSICAFADRITHERIEVEDNAVAILTFANGAKGIVAGSTSCYSATGHPAEVHVLGSEGSVMLKDDKFRHWEFKNALPEDDTILADHGEIIGAVGVGAADPSAIDFSGHTKTFEDALTAFRNGTKPFVDGPEGRRAIEVILAIYASALEGGKRIDLPLAATPDLRSFR